MLEGECLSTIAIAAENSSFAQRLPGGMGLRLPVGAPCDNFRGYCDFLNNCFEVDSEGLCVCVRERERGGGGMRWISLQEHWTD